MAKAKQRLTHLTASNQPTMVTWRQARHGRVATAEARVTCRDVARELKRTSFGTKKGPVFDTAIIAGVLAAKRTHELIPFCHPLPLTGVQIDVAVARGGLRITCGVTVTHTTGVEMEALTGAAIAALTVYDMCKALSHDIVIGPCDDAETAVVAIGERRDDMAAGIRLTARCARGLAGGAAPLGSDKAAMTCGTQLERAWR